MIEKRLRTGGVAYYWSPQRRDAASGFPLHAEALGTDYGAAKARADMLNSHLDAWRHGRGEERTLDAQPGFGSLDWMVERYKRSDAWARVGARSKPGYDYAMRLVLEMPRKSGRRVGEARLEAIDAAAVDKLYQRMQVGPRGPRLRTANVAMMRLARAWDAVRRLHPRDVPADNPFRGLALTHGKGTSHAATRDQALALHRALIAADEPHLAAVPLICFDLLQRPENVLSGRLTWHDWRPADHPFAARVEHAKTGEMVWHDLFDLEDLDDTGAPRPFFPELVHYLAALPRLGVPVVMRRARRGNKAPAVLFTFRDARARVRRAARAAGLPEWLTLAACRHGGMTELGDAGATEAEVMASSGHRTPDAARIYIKRTAAQRLSASKKRRALRESGK